MIVGNLLGVYGYLIFNFVFAQSEAFPKGQLDPDNSMFAPLPGALVTFWCLVSTHYNGDQIQYLSAHRCPIVWFGLYAAINRGCPEQS